MAKRQRPVPYPPDEPSYNQEIQALRREELESTAACSKADRVCRAYAMHGRTPPPSAIFFMAEEDIVGLEKAALLRGKK